MRNEKQAQHGTNGGAKAAEIPFYLPSKFQLIINLKAAKTLSIDISSTLLACADEVIE